MAISSPARLHHLPQSCRRPAALTNRQCVGTSPATCRWRPRRLLPVAAAPLQLRAVRATDDARQPFGNGPGPGTVEEDEGEHPRLKIAIIGFGNFGQFLARTFARQGHTLLAHSRSDHSAAAAALGATFFADPHDLCECQPDVVILTTSILSAEGVLRSLPVHRFRRNTLFVDVLSVKEFPKNLLLNYLPEDFDIICTHPMFGPESAGNSWGSRPFVYDKVRVGDSPARRARAEAFLDIFAREGCRMEEMSCADHDELAAETQLLTHTLGRMLALLDLHATPIDTIGYEALLRLVENTCSDSFDLFNGLFMYNKNSMELLNRLEWALDSVKRRLFDELHQVLRRQLFEGSPPLDKDTPDSSYAAESSLTEDDPDTRKEDVDNNN